MASRAEVLGSEPIGGENALRTPWRLESSHAPLSLARRFRRPTIRPPAHRAARAAPSNGAWVPMPRLSGHALRPAAVHTMHGTLLDAASPWAASMMRDIDHQAPRLEADHIVGDLIRRARCFGVDVPLMQVAYAHLQVYEARQRQAQGPVRPRQEAAGTARPLTVDHASASA